MKTIKIPALKIIVAPLDVTSFVATARAQTLFEGATAEEFKNVLTTATNSVSVWSKGVRRLVDTTQNARVRVTSIWLLFVMILGAANNACAALTGVPSLSGMLTNDTVDWGTLGQAGQAGISIGNPFDISSALGIEVNGSQEGGGFIRVDQDAGFTFTGGWDGNFLEGTHLIATLLGPVTLHFDPPIEAVGFQMNGGIGPAGGADGSDGAFTGTIQAFDTNGISLGSYSQRGVNTDTADGSAKFIGVASDSPNISTVVISESDASHNSGEFAIGPLNFYDIFTNNLPNDVGYWIGNDYDYYFLFNEGSPNGANDEGFWSSLDGNPSHVNPLGSVWGTDGVNSTNETLIQTYGVGIFGAAPMRAYDLASLTNTASFYVLVQLSYSDNSGNLWDPSGGIAGLSQDIRASYQNAGGYLNAYLRFTGDSQSCQLNGTPTLYMSGDESGPYTLNQAEGIVLWDTPFPFVIGGDEGGVLNLEQTNTYIFRFNYVPRGNYTFYATITGWSQVGNLDWPTVPREGYASLDGILPLNTDVPTTTIKAEGMFVLGGAPFRTASSVAIQSPTDNAAVSFGGSVAIHYRMAVDYPESTWSWTYFGLLVDGQVLTNQFFDWLDATPLIDDTTTWTPTSVGSHTIEIVGADTMCGYYTNAITVNVANSVSVPKPNISNISLSGSNLVINAVNGSSGSAYVTLMSTNLWLPFSQWTPVATNTLNASGNFTITAINAVDVKAPQRFYTLRMH